MFSACGCIVVILRTLLVLTRAVLFVVHQVSEKARERTNTKLGTSLLEEILSSSPEKVLAMDEPQTPIPPAAEPMGQFIYVHVIRHL